MGLARELARLRPNTSGLLPNTNIEAMAASKLTGQVPDANAPSGSVIQVQQFITTSSFSTTSSSFTDVTGFNASITPSNANNKVLVMLTAFTTNAAGSNYTWVRVMRGATEVIPQTVSMQTSVFGSTGDSIAGHRLDSPNTTSQVTYQIQLQSEAGGTARIGGGGQSGGSGVGATVLTLMEISA